MNLVARLPEAADAAALGLSGEQPLALHTAGGVWRVTGRFVDLFAVRVRNGQPDGRRHFLLRLTDRMPLLGLGLAVPDGGWTILAVGGLEAGALPAGPGADQAACIEAWIALLEALFGGADPGWGAVLPASPGATALRAGERLTVTGAPIWVRVQAGRLALPDGALLTPSDPPVPLADGRHVRADTEAKVEVAATLQMMQAGMLDAALSVWHAALLGRIGGLVDRRTASLATRQAASAGASARILADGLGRLAGLPDAQEAARMAADADLQAIARVASALGQSPAEVGSDLPPGAARIDALIGQAGLRGRRVLLRGRWWRSNHGPLIGMRAEDGAAVAILPDHPRLFRRTGNLIWLPQQAAARRLDAASAAVLSGTAWMLYRALPDAAPGPGGLLRFALAGGGPLGARLILASLAASVLGLGVPLATGVLVQDVIPASSRGDIVLLGAGLAAAALGTACVNLVRAILLLQIESRLDLNTQPALFDRLLRLPPAFFKRFGAGDLADRAMGVQELRQVLTGNTLSGLFAGLLSVVNLAVMLGCGASLAASGLAVAACQAGAAALLALLQVRRERIFATRRGQAESFVLQCVSGVAKLKTAAATDRAFALWARLFARQRDAFLAARRIGAAQLVVPALLLPAGTAILFVLGAHLALRAPGGLGLGAWVAFSAAFGQLTAGLAGLVEAVGGMLSVVPLYERARPLLDARPESARGAPKLGAVAGEIEFCGVTFAYGEAAPPVLQDLSFSIRAGEFVAIVGPSGCGKSTILRLLLGFETPQAGEILVDGHILSTLDIAALRRQIGVVLQNGRIQPGSLVEAIGGGRPVTLEEAWTAARLSGLEADIKAMPMGLHTMLTDGGGTLSGGQRQRLMIARALAGRPKILLLDEATSALDNRTQAIVTDAVAALGLTRIVIAHRLSTIARADRVLVIDRGQLVQSGEFAELAAAEGVFRELAKRQIV
jgi:NHLM bacteriocin system ABC transporter ATP-binding protein